jgi:arylsulfatase A-like enzyme
MAALALPGAAREGATGVHGIVLVTIDTLRADHVGAYGAPFATPTLDRLAEEGVLVEQAVTPTPSTGPAHASLMTGLHPWNHGTLRNAVPLDPRIPTLADRLRQRGYATAAVVSSYILSRRFGFHQGFDHFEFDPNQEFQWAARGGRSFYATRADHTSDAAMQWITDHGEKPFFLWVHYFDPHSPYDPPPGYAVSPSVEVRLEGKRIPESVNGPETLKRLIRAYRSEVLYTDAQLGRLVERLRILGLLDRTALVVTADHGEGLGDHGVLEHGVSLFDELVRVPLIVRAPGVPPGRRLPGPAQLEDLVPTLLALAGAEPPAELDGIDLLPWLRGQTGRSPREASFGRRRPYKGEKDHYFERRFPAKWIGALEGRGVKLDLAEDPRELRPQKAEGPPRALRQRVAAARHDGEAEVESDPEVLRALEALGYLRD